MNEQERLQQIIDILSDNAHEMCAIDGDSKDIILDANMDGVQTVAREICNVFQPIQKDARSRRERQLDVEFERMGVKPRVYHFTKGMEPFKAVTIATVSICTKNGARNLIREAISVSTRHSFFQPATRILSYLHEPCGEYGIAICDHSDHFDKRYGRNKAKGRLLQYLLKEQKR